MECPCCAGRRETAEFKQARGGGRTPVRKQDLGKPGDQETGEEMVVNVQKMLGLTCTEEVAGRRQEN